MLCVIKSSSDYIQNSELRSVLSKINNTNNIIDSKNLTNDKPAKREVVYFDAKNYKSGDIFNLTTQSLFGDSPILVIENAEKTTDELIIDIKKICADSEKLASSLQDKATQKNITPDVIILHSGIVRGKAMLDTVKKSATQNSANFMFIDEKAPEKPAEKVTFVKTTFSKFGKKINNDAANLLVEYEGENIAILAGYIKQLSNDIGDVDIIDDNHIKKFFSGIKQVAPWEIVNAAFSRNASNAILLYRNSVALKSPASATLPLITMLFNQLNSLVKVSAMKSRRLTGREIGIYNDWQLNEIKRKLSFFNSAKLKNALDLLKMADLATKGASYDEGVLATENALRIIAS